MLSPSRAEWMRNFSVELLRQSPSPALREAFQLAQVTAHIDNAHGMLIDPGAGR